jgi:hypothetical protein
MRKFALAFGLLLLALTGAQVRAADFESEKQVVSLMLDWPAVDGGLRDQLSVMKVPRKLQISSIQFVSTVATRAVMMEVSEFRGDKRIEHTLTLAPSFDVKKVNGREIMEVSANFAPRSLGMEAPTMEDSDGVQEFYFQATFQTNEKFEFIKNLSFRIIENSTTDRYHIQPQESVYLEYVVRPMQMEFDYPNLIALPRVIDTHATLGSKELKLFYRFTRQDLDMSVAKRLRCLGVPRVLDLASIKVAAGLLGTQIHLPFVDSVERTGRMTIVAGTSLFEIQPENKKFPLKFKHDLTPQFDFGSDSASEIEGVIKYVLTLEFSTNESFSKVADMKLVLNRIQRADPEEELLVHEVVASYDLEEVQYKLPIYPGDDR